MAICVLCHHCGQPVRVGSAIFCPAGYSACSLAHLPDLRLVAPRV